MTKEDFWQTKNYYNEHYPTLCQLGAQWIEPEDDMDTAISFLRKLVKENRLEVIGDLIKIKEEFKELFEDKPTDFQKAHGIIFMQGSQDELEAKADIQQIKVIFDNYVVEGNVNHE